VGAQADLSAAEAVAGLLGREVVGVAPLGGAYQLRLADGTAVVAKRHLERSAVNAEVAGLRWLRAASGPPSSSLAADTDDIGPPTGNREEVHPPNVHESPIGAPGGPPVSSLPGGTDISAARGPRVPAVLGFDDEWLVMEVVPSGRPSVRAAEEFGRALAALHRAGAAAFGMAPPGGPVDAWIGLAPMRNVTGARWPRWYAEQRVLPYVRKAVDLGVLHDAAVIEDVCARLGDLAGPDEPPARLHGDLWSGNVLWSDGGVWLIDPAAHGGHRETDLAMLHLFGCPHLERIVAAYDESAPLAAGWRERIPLHQLFPLLVHTVLFGGGYGAQAVAAARSLA
jgi:fructosamine-3-kinase